MVTACDCVWVYDAFDGQQWTLQSEMAGQTTVEADRSTLGQSRVQHQHDDLANQGHYADVVVRV